MSSFYDLASLVMIPSGKKAGKVYSQKPLTTDGQLDFTRASTATRIGSDGLIEKTRTNLLLQSNQFNTTWTLPTGLTLTAGQSGYNGSNAWKLETDGSSGFLALNQTFSLSGVNAFSIYAKAGTNDYLSLRSLTGTDVRAQFNLSNGTVHASSNQIEAKITSVGSSWYRCSVSFSASNNAFYIYPNIQGTANAGHVFIQDAQLEAGLVATNVITTTTAAVSVGSVDNMPRLNYTPGSATSCPSLLLEPQRTNITTQSEYLADTGVWARVRADVESNTLISPDGTQNASTLSCTDFAETYIQDNVPIGTTTGTFSFFAKKGNLDYCHSLVWDLSASGRRQWFNLATGQVGTSTAFGTDYDKVDAGMEDYGNGWYRCWFAWENGNTNSGVRLNNSNGDGSTNAAINSFNYFYGCQTESGVSYKTSYIPTFGATVTRVADICDKTSVSGLIGQTEGALYVQVGEFPKESNGRIFGISNGTSSTYIIIIKNGANKDFAVYVTNGGTAQATYLGTGTLSDNSKIAVGYASNDYVVYVNGTQVHTDTGASVPACSDIYVGHRENGSSTYIMAGTIKQGLLFKTRLTNDQLAELTSTDS